MDADFAKLWVADLRNPEHTQCTGKLHDGKGYCCLGRAAVLAGATLVPMREMIYRGDPEFGDARVEIRETPATFVIDGTQYPADEAPHQLVGGQQEKLTTSLAEQIGLRWPNGGLFDREIEIDGRFFDSLADANDSGCTFNQIADWIEVNYDRL